MSSYDSVAGHRSMVFDDVRNKVYGDALGRVIHPGSVVLDLGAGLGIHGLVAAAKGARRVYLVDPSSVTGIARLVARDNGLADRVVCIEKPVSQANLPEKVDVILSVFTGNFLLDEDLLPILFHARDRYLKPGGILLPDRAEMQVVPVSADKYYDMHIAQWSKRSQSISFECVRRFVANNVYFDGAGAREAELLAEPLSIASLDFNSATRAACSSQIEFEVRTDGTCHGFVGWFRMCLDGSWLSTSPLERATHWSQAFLPLDPPLQVKGGETVRFRLIRPQYGDWTWIAEHAGTSQRHSTFLAGVKDPEKLRCNSKQHRVMLNDKGELAAFVVQRMTGAKPVGGIIDEARQRFGDRFGPPEELERRVQSVISAFGK